MTTGMGAASVVLGVEARDVTKHPTMYWTAPITKKYPAQMSIVLRVRNPDRGEGTQEGSSFRREALNVKCFLPDLIPVSS